MPVIVPPKPAAAPGHGARKHHKYGMSKLGYLDDCAGFSGKSGTTQAAEDGTRLHEIMDQVVMRYAEAKTTAKDALKDVLVTLTISEDEEFYLSFCCTELDFWLSRMGERGRVFQEECVTVSDENGAELNHGFYDTLILLTPETGVMVDYKFGWMPVPPADQNLQGMGYAVGCFQKFPELQRLGIIFAQPKLGNVTRCSYKRTDLPVMVARIKGVIDKASRPDKILKQGPYCDYCAKAATCSAVLNNAVQAVSVHQKLPMPITFTGLEIKTPEEAAKALYVIQRLEILIEESGLKTMAKDFARANDGRLECEIAPGERVIVTLHEKNSARSANSPALIADALKDVLTPEQVLSCCDPMISRLEQTFADEFVAKRKIEADAVLASAEARAVTADNIGEKKLAKQIRADAKEEAKSIRTTKKQAAEILSATLQSEGLLSMPTGRVEYLRVRVEKDTKQISA